MLSSPIVDFHQWSPDDFFFVFCFKKFATLVKTNEMRMSAVDMKKQYIDQVNHMSRV